MTTPSLRIGLAVEGESDWEFFQTLAQRIVGGVVPSEVVVSFVRIGRRERSETAIAALICEAFLGRAIDIVCVHKDADSNQRLPDARDFVAAVCGAGFAECGLPGSDCIPIVPMRETEAWALSDPDALCRVFRISRLPAETLATLRDAELIRDPKATLAGIVASIRRRRRGPLPLQRIAEEISLTQLDRLASFTRFRAPLETACHTRFR